MSYKPEFISPNFLSSASEVNPKSEMKIEYFPYSDEWGYWTIDNLWTNFEDYVKLSSLSPATPASWCDFSSNWMHKQNILTVQIEKIRSVMIDFNNEYIKKDVNIKGFKCWSNVVEPNSFYVVPSWTTRPHTDSHIENNTLIFNTWMNEDSNGGTAFWKSKEGYPSSYENEHKYVEYIKDTVGCGVNVWSNFQGDDHYEKLAETPSNYGKVIVYTGAQWHSPVVNDITSFRWSHVVSTSSD